MITFICNTTKICANIWRSSFLLYYDPVAIWEQCIYALCATACILSVFLFDALALVTGETETCCSILTYDKHIS